MRTKSYIVYKFDELSDESQVKAVIAQIEFEIEVMTTDSPYYKCAVEMDKMQTPWFLAETILDKCKESIVETIKANEYEFTADGEID